MKRIVLSAGAVLLPMLILAKDEPMRQGHTMQGISPTDPLIKITINPEERVSVILTGALPPAVPCGTHADVAVKIVNQGFVTSRLEAQFVGETPAGASLDFHPEPLRGVPEEIRNLQIILTEPGVTDLTIAFRAHHGSSDLGGRDRVHFLMHCLPIR